MNRVADEPPPLGRWLRFGASGQPCDTPAALVLVPPGGETLRFSCAEHREGWATRIHRRYEVLEWDEWVARGRGYRGAELGG